MDNETLGIIRLLSILSLFLLSNFYWMDKKNLARAFLFCLFGLLIIEMIITAELLAHSIGIVFFLLMPLLVSPIFYLVQLYSRYKVEKLHGKSGIKIEFRPFEGYKNF